MFIGWRENTPRAIMHLKLYKREWAKKKRVGKYKYFSKYLGVFTCIKCGLRGSLSINSYITPNGCTGSYLIITHRNGHHYSGACYVGKLSR
jgi:hypothetical protein